MLVAPQGTGETMAGSGQISRLGYAQLLVIVISSPLQFRVVFAAPAVASPLHLATPESTAAARRRSRIEPVSFLGNDRALHDTTRRYARVVPERGRKSNAARAPGPAVDAVEQPLRAASAEFFGVEGGGPGRRPAYLC